MSNNLSTQLIVQVMILSKQIAQASISTTGAIGQVTIQSKQLLQKSNWSKLQSPNNLKKLIKLNQWTTYKFVNKMKN